MRAVSSIRTTKWIGRVSFYLSISVMFLLVFVLTDKTALAVDYSREEVSLNGTWDFHPEGGTTAYNIAVPSYWDVNDGFDHPQDWSNVDYGEYKRDFTVPSSMSGKQIFIELEQLSVLGKVYVNGQQVTDQSTNGYYMMGIPYKLDVTSLVNIGSSNSLEVRIWTYDSLPQDAKDANGKVIYPYGVDDTPWGKGRGIIGDVKLTASPKVYISDTYVIADLKGNTDPSDDEISVQVTVTNKSGNSSSVTLKNQIELVGGSLEKTFVDQSVTIAANNSETVTLSNVAWTDAQYWWPHDPKLYMLQTSLEQSGTTVDSFDTRFGFRQFNINGNYFELNGIKTNLRGDSIEFNAYQLTSRGASASYQYNYSDGYMDSIKLIMDEWKTINMNVVRTHIGGARKGLFEYADEIGLMVIDESVFWQYQNRGSVHSIPRLVPEKFGRHALQYAK